MENLEVATDRKKKMIIAGTVFSLVVVIFIIIIVAASKKVQDTHDQDKDDPLDVSCANPLCEIFASEPEFQDYQYDDSHVNFEEQFW